MLRDYQLAAIDRTRDAFRRGRRAVLIVAPTGAGKSVIGAELARIHGELRSTSASNSGRVVWLTHRAELIDQSASHLRALGLDVGTLAAGRDAVDAPVTVASIQTLLARGTRPPASLIIMDEARHMVASRWRELAHSAAWTGVARVGLDATPERADGRGLGDIFDSMVEVASIGELVAGGWLVPCRVIAPGHMLGAGEIAGDVLEAYRAHCAGRPTIVYAPHVRAATEWLRAMLDAGVRAGLVHGELASAQRSSIVRAYREGVLDVLINCHVLTEGFDSPASGAVIIGRGCGSVAMWLQICGRVMRPFHGKTEGLVVDLRGSVWAHGEPGDDRSWSLDGVACRRLDPVDCAPMCRVCGAILVDGLCGDCGRPPGEAPMPKIVSSPMVRFAAKRMEDTAARVATLRRWLGRARAAGWADGWASHRYRAVYGVWPSPDIRRQAG